MPKRANKTRGFRWDEAKVQAALLFARGELTYAEISKATGIAVRTLTKHRQKAEFVARIDGHVRDAKDRARRNGISVVENRIAALQSRWEKMNQVIAERGAAESMQAVPGGKTGLMVHNVKNVGGGENAERVDLYEVDTALLKELREHEKQTAQELGQWMEKHDHTTGGKPMSVKIIRGVSMDDL